MSRPEYVVHTQDEYVAAVEAHGAEDCAIRVDSDPAVVLRIDRSGRLAETVVGSASVVEVGGSASVVEVGGSARVVEVGDSARVERVGDSARVERVGDSARVEWVGDSARVEWVGDSARVGHASGRAVLDLYGHATVDHAGQYVCVYLHSGLATVSGGHRIDLTALDLSDTDQWIAYTGAQTDDDGNALLYKAVDAQLCAGHQYRLTTYTIGGTVIAPDWRDDHACGGGLHLSPTPQQALGYYGSAARMLLCAVPRESLRPIGEDKAKAPMCRVVREVALDGSELVAS